MTAIRWLETDALSNQNIASAAAIGAYTAAADRLIMCQAFVDQAAGGGDYVMYCTLQIGGAGSSYVILPKTTMTAAAGETAIAGQSGWINVRNGDVVTVYVDGLAGDTTTPDTIVRWFEDAALQPTTADTTLDIAATGEAGLDFANIKAATAPTTLTNITVPVVTDVTNAVPANLTQIGGVVQSLTDFKDFVDNGYNPVTNAVINVEVVTELDGIALGDINAEVDTALADYDPPTNAEMIARTLVAASYFDPATDAVTVGAVNASGLKDFFDTNSGDTYAGAVAGSVVKEIADNAGGASLTTAQIWAYTSRTLTQSAAQVADIVSGSSITIQRGDTLSAALTGLGAITGYTTLDFTVKYDKANADTDAIIRIRKNASGVGDGLIRLNGAAATTAADGSITISDLAAGNITIALVASDTDDLIPGQGYYYDIQKITGTTVLTMTTGTFNVAADVTRLVA